MAREIEMRRVSRSEFAAMADEWNGFLRSSNHDCLFLTWEWLTAWWEAFQAPHREHWCHAARDAGGNLLGLFPLMRVASTSQRPCRLRTLQMTGRGIEGVAGGSEYAAFLMPPLQAGAELELTEELIRHLERERKSWDVLFLDNLVEQHPTTSAVERVVGSRRPARLRLQEINYVLRLPSSHEAFLAELTTGQRTNLRRRSRLLEGRWSVDLTSLTSHADVDRYLDAYFELVRRRHGWTPTPAKALFMRRLCELFLPTGALRFSLLWLDGRPAATMFGFAYDRRYLLYKAAFDPDPAFARVGLGAYMRCRVIAALIEEGIGELDYLIGSYDYKREWSNHQRTIRNVTLYGHRPSTLLRAGVNKACDMLRRARLRMGRRTRAASGSDAAE